MARLQWNVSEEMQWILTTDQLFILITKSPKRDIILSEINEDRSLGNTGFRMLSSILWTMRALITGMLLTCYDITTLWRS